MSLDENPEISKSDNSEPDKPYCHTCYHAPGMCRFHSKGPPYNPPLPHQLFPGHKVLPAEKPK